MIKSINFLNFRNVKGIYEFNDVLSIVIGKNNSGKTNLLDGIKLAFSAISGDFFKLSTSDFYNSDDSKNIEIHVELEENSIPSLTFYDANKSIKTGFVLKIRKTQSGKYVKEINMLNGSNVDYDILREDPNIPNVFSIPLIRMDEIYTNDLITGISKFIDSEEKYSALKEDSKNKMRKIVKNKVEVFQNFCKKFNQDFDIAFTEPRIIDEKVYVVETGQQEHNYKIGSGYKSIANIILNSLNDKYKIILIDEIENNLHPSLIRTLIRELKQFNDTQIIATTHSAVVINEFEIDNILDINKKKIAISESNLKKLNIFMHPGRSELLMSDNVVLVEGYTEEILIKSFVIDNNYNWTVVNVAGIMFEPYIELASRLNKKIVVISDNDISLSDDLQPSQRFINLKKTCKEYQVSLIEINNTLETDLYDNGYLEDFTDLLKHSNKHNKIMIAKNHQKTMIAQKIIEKKTDLSEWHVIKELVNEFTCD